MKNRATAARARVRKQKAKIDVKIGRARRDVKRLVKSLRVRKRILTKLQGRRAKLK
jgi:hypothetical protein